MSSYSIIGLMSGTSMDGLDIANCTFNQSENGSWKYTVNQTETRSYPEDLERKLREATQMSAVALLQLDKELGAFFADSVLDFMRNNELDKKITAAIASHGHTVFHQPEKGFTYQIGCGETLSFLTGIPVINDFRQKDVIAGGQGAPLVPIGDILLFAESAGAFLNIGGFCNISFPGTPTIAYDICPGNLPLNRIVQKEGIPFDKNGQLAARGTILPALLDELNKLNYYSLPYPKSLGTEWLDAVFTPLMNDQSSSSDLLRTLTEHIAVQIAHELNKTEVERVMITGGGAKNSFLIERIQVHFKGRIHIPSDQLIDFKEAIIFAFLGALYLSGQTNCRSEVTGASRDVIGGVLHIP